MCVRCQWWSSLVSQMIRIKPQDRAQHVQRQLDVLGPASPMRGRRRIPVNNRAGRSPGKLEVTNNYFSYGLEGAFTKSPMRPESVVVKIVVRISGGAALFTKA